MRKYHFILLFILIIPSPFTGVHAKQDQNTNDELLTESFTEGGFLASTYTITFEDMDSDNLIDNVLLEVDVSSEGSTSIDVTLDIYDTNYSSTIFLKFMQFYFSGGTNTITINIPGYIFADSTDTSITFDIRGTGCDEDGCKTFESISKDIENPKTWDSEPVSAYNYYYELVDEDDDQLYDYLILIVELNFTQEAKIRGQFKAYVENEKFYEINEYLEQLPGSHNFTVSIPGHEIRKLGYTGDILINSDFYLNMGVYQIAISSLDFTIPDINSAEFQQYPVYMDFNAILIEYEDLDDPADGTGDVVVLTLPVISKLNDSFYIDISIYVNFEDEYVSSDYETFLINSPGMYNITFKFPYFQFKETGIYSFKISGYTYSEFLGQEIYEAEIDVNKLDRIPISVIENSYEVNFVDSDANGLYNYIELSIEVNYIQIEEFEIRLTGIMANDYGNIEYKTTFFDELGEGRHTLSIIFPLYAVIVHELDGEITYQLEISIYTSMGSMSLDSFVLLKQTNSSDFDESPLTLVENSMTVELRDTDFNSKYDDILVSIELSTTVEALILLELTITGPFFYSGKSKLSLLPIGTSTVSISIPANKVRADQYSGDLTFILGIMVESYDDWYHIDSQNEDLYIDYEDFDDPQVVFDPDREIIAESMDLNSNGFYDVLTLRIPVIINDYEPVNIRLSLYQDSLILYVTFTYMPRRGDSYAEYSIGSGIIKNGLSSDACTVNVLLKDLDGNRIGTREETLNSIDPDEYDDYAASVDDFSSSHEIWDVNGDSVGDWLNISISVNFRLSGEYSILALIELGGEETTEGLPLSSQIRVSSPGTQRVDLMLNALYINEFKIQNYTILELYISSGEYYENIPIIFDGDTYTINRTNLGGTPTIIGTTLSSGDTLTYLMGSYVLFNSHEIIYHETIEINVISEDGNILTIDLTGEDNFQILEVDKSSRYLRDQENFPFQLDPSKLSLGVWLDPYVGSYLDLYAMVTAETTFELENGEILDCWLITDGFDNYLYEKSTGVLVTMHMLGQLYILKETNMGIANPVVITPVITNSNSEDAGFLAIPMHFYIIGLVIIVVTKRKHSKSFKPY
ncbi:MAG: hypothetical protein INQ03_10825 [Candidatus Heimdallarchaeota archaeon]|nr:hypothetical protein [Candidatus Heimdallarchaeota archaeon]